VHDRQQVRRDVEDPLRVSYRGTANELREILRELLSRLAPDEEVMSQPWFAPRSEAGASAHPTRQQRARFILEKRGAGSKVKDVAEGALSLVEEGLSKLVTDMYSRTSAASHTAQDVKEIKKQVRYFDALVHDLCGKT